MFSTRQICTLTRSRPRNSWNPHPSESGVGDLSDLFFNWQERRKIVGFFGHFRVSEKPRERFLISRNPLEVNHVHRFNGFDESRQMI